MIYVTDVASKDVFFNDRNKIVKINEIRLKHVVRNRKTN